MMALPKMDSRIGLDYIVENNDYISKLGTALDTNNFTVKKQVFELLSALCAYNSEGYSRAIEALDYFKNLKKERYRFKLIITELEKADVVEYQIALLAFINCVIISAPNLQDRLRIRNEFIGLNLLPILSNLRRVAHSVGDIIVQLDVFDEQRECDEDQSLQGPNGINLNSHLDVFYAILRQVADTPQEIPFLSILQHLLRIDSKEAISDIIWDTTEKLVHRATLLENHEDSARLLRAPSIQKFQCQHCRGDAISPNRKQSNVIPTTPSSIHPSLSSSSLCAPPPPPPPPMMNNNQRSGAAPIPPPPALNLFLSAHNTENSNCRPKTPEPFYNELQKLLPQQDTPAPKSKMKTINWNKIPPNKVLGKRNIWAIVADTHQDSPMADLDWNEMEGLFCQQITTNQNALKSNLENGTDVVDRKTRKENSEISLLDGKRSLNVNIFLKQFRSSNENIIHLIRNGQHDDIGAEKLKGLLKILPEVDEVEMLRSFDGDKSRLGNAEKFLLQLLKVPNYKLRIECMLLKEEFATNVGYLEPFMNSMLYTGHDLMNNKLLQEVLYMVVVAGNFLNSGGYAGNAAGVKLSSLQKLTDIRANKPGMNLIHFVALQGEKRNPDLLSFPAQMSALENASKTTPEQINNEINALDSRIKKIRKQIELNTTEMDIKNQMMEFLKVAESDLSVLQQGMKEVDLVRNKLAEFFCEDPSTFKIEECFKIFQNFCEKFKQAIKENERRRIQEEQATLRKRQREEQVAKKAKQSSQCGTPISDPENSFFLDPSQFDMKCSPSMSRRRMGSFNSSGEMKEDGMSPDITPNGSLRRRRSRILMEEDEGNLMEFLRNSGHDNGTRERKVSGYGSLDRSWARRAQTGSSTKKRPDLLNIDFGQDRERPNSPSPLAESKPVISQEEPKPRISKEWRQKIESWLQSNETDERQIDDYKRRRRLVTKKRLLENDTESERNKLDPLPEEKATIINNNSMGVIDTADSYKRVYPDWKPSTTLEKTDVVRTIEAIEDAQNLNKDISVWRESNLQSLNSFDKSENENLSIKHQQQQLQNSLCENSDPKPTLSSILNDKRKSLIQKLGEKESSDSLQIYIRRPSDSDDNSPKENLRLNNGNSLDNNYSILLHDHKGIISKNHINSYNNEINPRKEIHPIERNGSISIDLNKSSKSHNLQSLNNDLLSSSNFDRFSATRKTRRYKKQIERVNNVDVVISSIPTTLTPLKSSDTKDYSQSDNKEDRLKRWQEQLKERTKDTGTIIAGSGRTVAKLEKVGRHISSINQEDVREAIRNLKSPTRTPERLWSPPREIPKDNIVVKISNIELNDEGFEETQSLVSDTPSHGKESNSSCNEPAVTGIKKISSLTRKHLPGASISSSSTKKPRPITSLRSNMSNFIENNRHNFERSRSMKTPTPINSPTHAISSRRTNSFRSIETPSQSKIVPQNSRDVERSSSRTSLRSSRSSLNSVISTSTVRKMGQKPQILSTTTSTSLSSSKRPLVTQNTAILKRTTNRVPASRSSSSGSSIGLSHSKPPMKTSSSTHLGNSLGGASFKENHQRAASGVIGTKILVGNVQSINHHKSIHNNGNSTNIGNRTTNKLIRNTSASSRLNGFMRPTTSSTTKRQH